MPVGQHTIVCVSSDRRIPHADFQLMEFEIVMAGGKSIRT